MEPGGDQKVCALAGTKSVVFAGTHTVSHFGLKSDSTFLWLPWVLLRFHVWSSWKKHLLWSILKTSFIPGHPKVPCFLEVFCYIKPSKKHSFGCLGMFHVQAAGVLTHSQMNLHVTGALLVWLSLKTLRRFRHASKKYSFILKFSLIFPKKCITSTKTPKGMLFGWFYATKDLQKAFLWVSWYTSLDLIFESPSPSLSSR